MRVMSAGDARVIGETDISGCFGVITRTTLGKGQVKGYVRVMRVMRVMVPSPHRTFRPLGPRVGCRRCGETITRITRITRSDALTWSDVVLLAGDGPKTPGYVRSRVRAGITRITRASPAHHLPSPAQAATVPG
jgi:hypothetical protein